MAWQPLNLSETCPASTPITSCSNFGFVYLNLLLQLYGGSEDQRTQDLCDQETIREQRDGVEYDFIVVGAGAAGCVNAHRLTENPNWKVLLLEAGGAQPDITQVPGLSPVLLGSSVDWRYTTEPNGKSCLASPGGRCAWPRGKMMGGSSSINFMAYVRGNKEDYDTWARMGNKGWNYKEVFPFFIKSERNLNKYSVDSKYHGVKGEQYVSWFPYVDDAANMMVEAYVERGIPYGDFNGAEQDRTMQTQAFSVEGSRASTNTAYIKPIRHLRPNLYIKIHSEALKILIDDLNNAYGIVYIQDGKLYTAYAKKEVIISAGTINSPKLLMLSGIGPREHLESLNIPVVKDLAVGENLHDHVCFNGIIIALSNRSSTVITEDAILNSVVEYSRQKTKIGPLSGNGPLMSAFIKSDSSLSAPDLQFHALPIFNWAEYIQDPITNDGAKILPSPYYDAIIPRIINVVPRSRGRILLNGTNPFGHPELYVNYLDDDRDYIPLLWGIHFVLSLESTEAFRSRGAYYVHEKMPHCLDHEWGTDEYFVCLIRQYTTATHHQVGTCKMGPPGDIKAVVDNELRVYGVQRLRVIDASIMPVAIRGNTNAPTMMIAERGMDFLISYWRERTKNYCF